MKIMIGVLLILHGMIVAAQSGGSFRPPSEGIPNPGWVTWWPTNLGQSWLLSGLGLQRMPFTTLVLLLNLAGGIALLGAGLGVLGVLVPTGWVVPLTVSGAAFSLIMLAIYLHPLYVLGISANVGILVALFWTNWPSRVLGLLP
jgi:hypothetical protein